MFKNNNPKYKGLFDVMEKTGATINATTSYDRTNFYCVYHKAYFSQWAQAEAVRMAHPPFSYEKDNTERFVVRTTKLFLFPLSIL